MYMYLLYSAFTNLGTIDAEKIGMAPEQVGHAKSGSRFLQ